MLPVDAPLSSSRGLSLMVDVFAAQQARQLDSRIASLAFAAAPSSRGAGTSGLTCAYEWRFAMRLREYPNRFVTGAYILHTGFEKWRADEATAKAVHGMAAGAYPIFKDLDPSKFLRLLAAGEIVVGTALLAPVVPTAVAGAALTGFSGALVGLYARTPGMRKEGSIWPTPQGIGLSKDSWLLAIGLALLADSCSRRRSG